MFCNFRKVGKESRFKMRLRDPVAYYALEDMEQANSKPIWIKISDWSGVLNHMAPERPSGAGQIIRKPERDDSAKKARIG